jgi:hypothetical protein
VGLIRFLIGAAIAGVAAYFFGGWALDESEQQIGKMQLNAYNSPGAESPIPRKVAGSAFALLGWVWFAQRRILRLPGFAAFMAMVVGIGGGLAALLLPAQDDAA